MKGFVFTGVFWRRKICGCLSEEIGRLNAIECVCV
jgi:hypothetical protein